MVGTLPTLASGWREGSSTEGGRAQVGDRAWQATAVKKTFDIQRRRGWVAGSGTQGSKHGGDG